MMIPLKDTFDKYGVNPKGVIQVGSHWAEEHEEFVRCGIERFLYIEPSKEAFEKLCEKMGSVYPSHRSLGGIEKIDEYGQRALVGVKDGRYFRTVTMFNVACGASPGTFAMFVSHQNQGQSNSLLEPKLHLTQHPEVVFDDAEVVKVVRLDDIIDNKAAYDFLYMDVQGYEGEVLKGATEVLKNVNIIYTECNNGQTYAGNMEVDEMDKYLEPFGFKRVETFWPSPNWTWGDAIYLKISA